MKLFSQQTRVQLAAAIVRGGVLQEWKSLLCSQVLPLQTFFWFLCDVHMLQRCCAFCRQGHAAANQSEGHVPGLYLTSNLVLMLSQKGKVRENCCVFPTNQADNQSPAILIGKEDCLTDSHSHWQCCKDLSWRGIGWKALSVIQLIGAEAMIHGAQCQTCEAKVPFCPLSSRLWVTIEPWGSVSVW